MIPPRNWLVAVFAFRILPHSNEPSQRATRTSQNCMPYEGIERKGAAGG